MRTLQLAAGWLLITAAVYLWWSFGKPVLPNPLRPPTAAGMHTAEVLNWLTALGSVVAGVVLLGYERSKRP
jgi:hypothetical protein